MYQFRVTEESDEALEKIVLWCRSQTKVLLAVQETGTETEKKHIHVLLEINKKSTFRQKFHRQFKDKYVGNGSHSLEIIKEALENNQNYLSKGEKKGVLPKILFTIYDSKDIEIFHNRYWEINEKTLKGKTKKTTTTWTQQVKEDFKTLHGFEKLQFYCSMYNPDDEQQKKATACKFQLFEFCIKRLGQAVKVLDESIIKRLYNGVYNSIIQEQEASASRFNQELFKSIILL